MTKRAKKPGFVLYIDDFLGGTVAMSAAEVGDYIRLLCDLYDKGGRIEANRDKLRHIFKCRPQDVANRLQRLIDLGKIFTDKNGLIHNGRVDREIENIEENAVDEASMTPQMKPHCGLSSGKKFNVSMRARAPVSKPSHTSPNGDVRAHARAPPQDFSSYLMEELRQMQQQENGDDEQPTIDGSFRRLEAGNRSAEDAGADPARQAAHAKPH